MGVKYKKRGLTRGKKKKGVWGEFGVEGLVWIAVVCVHRVLWYLTLINLNMFAGHFM